MKQQTETSFDELIKQYYGASCASETSNTAKIETLLTNYYGRPYKRRDTTKTAPEVSLSLTYDNGETLPQSNRPDRYEEYVVQQSGSAETFEEYVVNDYRRFPQPALAASIDIGPVEPVNAAQEYQVDVLNPLKPDTAPPTALAQSHQPPYPRSVGALPEEPSVTSQTFSATAETSRAQASDEDFMTDIKSILSGQTVYDPTTGTTVAKDTFAAAPAPTSANQNTANQPSFPEADKAQAIFDRIAQSMQYANKYDLGTVELENRFADFDRIAELQDKAKEAKKTKQQQRSANGDSAPAKVDSEDFLRDLDAIRSAGGAAPGPDKSESQSTEIPVSDQTDTGCMPFALSLSTADDPTEYSRPLYDTGEHVLTGWDLYTDQLRVGPSPGVMFSYGQIIAMPDLFASVKQMMEADVNELKTLKGLIQRSTNYYRGKMQGKADPSFDVSNDSWEWATHKRYLKLAEDNYEHFSPSPAFKSLPHVNASHGDNKSAWERHHRLAIEEAQRMLLAPENAKRPVFLERPLIINAFGDHFLTDAFASGHLINKDATIAYFKTNFFSGTSLKSEAKTFFDKVSAKAFTGKVKEKFSKLETEDFKWFHHLPVGHPDINNADRFAEVLKGIAEQAPEQIGNLAVKGLHDRLNKDGIEVTNNAGDGTWRLFGDGMMDNKGLGIIRKAVQQSVDNLNDPSIRGSKLDFNAYFSKVWKHIPQLTPVSLQLVERLTGEYTSPTSTTLIDAAAQIITEQVDLLIAKLLEAKALRSNKVGWLPNVI